MFLTIEWNCDTLSTHANKIKSYRDGRLIVRILQLVADDHVIRRVQIVHSVLHAREVAARVVVEIVTGVDRVVGRGLQSDSFGKPHQQESTHDATHDIRSRTNGEPSLLDNFISISFES